MEKIAIDVANCLDTGFPAGGAHGAALVNRVDAGKIDLAPDGATKVGKDFGDAAGLKRLIAGGEIDESGGIDALHAVLLQAALQVGVEEVKHRQSHKSEGEDAEEEAHMIPVVKDLRFDYLP